MKLINSKGKLFGIINVVDLLVLLAVVAVVIGVGYKLFAPKVAELVSPTVQMTSVMRVRGATPFLVTQVQNDPQVGKNLVSGNSYIADAVITDCQIVDYVQQVTTADGTIVDATDPSKKDIIFTITSTVPKDTPTPQIGTQEVRAGRTFILKTNSFETTANIDVVEFGE